MTGSVVTFDLAPICRPAHPSPLPPHPSPSAVFANSRDVAEFFEKRHDAVLRDIRDLLKKEPNLRLHSFVETVISRANPSGGAPIPSSAYDMSRDGFNLLGMGFTGVKAIKWKMKYIEAFNAMEAELRARPLDPFDLFKDPSRVFRQAA